MREILPRQIHGLHYCQVNWKINQHKYLTLNLISLKMALTNEAKILQSYITIVILISFVQV